MAVVNKNKIKAGVVGANGYSGIELCRLLMAHPNIELAACIVRDVQWSLANEIAFSPLMPLPLHCGLEDIEQQAENLDVLFLATPADVSLATLVKVRTQNKTIKLIDLSGALRLDVAQAKKTYGLDISAVEKTTYGLQPWNFPETNVVANPGCYATSILMAILPLIKNAVIDPASLVIDAKSGATGAGKTPKAHLQFSEVADSVVPYRVGEHQHAPEIQKFVQDSTGIQIDPHMCTHLLPIRRGIVSTIYADLKPNHNAQTVAQAFAEAYESYPFVQWSDSALKPEPLLKKVVGTPMTAISFKVCGTKLYMNSMIDNLMKGAASQAIENANLLFSLSIDAGLSQQWGFA